MGRSFFFSDLRCFFLSLPSVRLQLVIRRMRMRSSRRTLGNGNNFCSFYRVLLEKKLKTLCQIVVIRVENLVS